MKQTRHYLSSVFAGSAMVALILDTQTALTGAKEGLDLCLGTIIPSLFPFFVLSALLTGYLSHFRFRLLRPLGILCRLPKGSEALLILGMLGGYPTGAQNIAQQHSAGGISETDAKRLLGFCSNAGPAFLFGIIASQFPENWMTWALWGIHIAAAVLTGILLSGKAQSSSEMITCKPLSLPQAMENSLNNTAKVCGWVILFRVLMGFLTKWFCGELSNEARTILNGVLELSIGCCNLTKIGNLGLRFVVCSVWLGFGGLCVLMQTMSVTGKLGLGAYLPGKLLQAVLSFQISYHLQLILLPEAIRLTLPRWVIFGVWFFLFAVKITVAIGRIMMYNSSNHRNKRSRLCCFAKILPKPATTAPMAPASKRA